MPSYFWTDFDERLMAKFAENGRSQSYVARELGRSPRAIAIKAGQLKISFHGKPGAPLGNKNAAGRRQPAFWRDY